MGNGVELLYDEENIKSVREEINAECDCARDKLGDNNITEASRKNCVEALLR